jgi:hypothetical protein
MPVPLKYTKVLEPWFNLKGEGPCSAPEQLFCLYKNKITLNNLGRFDLSSEYGS